MKSSPRGTNTLTSKISNITSVGFWILIGQKEYFIPFKEYPAFKRGTIDSIFNVKFISPKQLYWKDLDIDIELDALEHPHSFPLAYTSKSKIAVVADKVSKYRKVKRK